MSVKKKIEILYLQLSNPKTKTLGGSFYSLLNMVTGLDKEKYNLTVAFYYQNHIMEKISHMGITTTILPYYRNIFMESDIVNLFKRLSKKNGNKLNASENGDFKKDENERTVFTIIMLLRDYLLSFRNAIPIKKIIKRGTFDIIHTNSGLTIDRAGILAGIWTKKIIVCHLRNTPGLSCFDKILSKHVHQFIAVSNVVRSLHYKNVGIPLNKIEVIYNSIDFNEGIYKNKNNLNSKQTKIGKTTFNVGIIGRIVHWKGHKDFLNSAKLLMLCDSSIRFKILGEGPLKQDMIAMVDKLKLDKYVTFRNYIKNKNDIYSDLDVVVVPSIRPDPFPRVVIEAMAFGIPVITTNIGGAIEIVENGKTGFLVEPESPNQIADVILKLKMDRELGVKIGNLSRNLMIENFNNNLMVEKISGIYNKLTS